MDSCRSCQTIGLAVLFTYSAGESRPQRHTFDAMFVFHIGLSLDVMVTVCSLVSSRWPAVS